MSAPCTCGECAELDLAFPGEGTQLTMEDDWISETRRQVEQARAERRAHWHRAEQELRP